MANLASEMAELRMVAMNISVEQRSNHNRMEDFLSAQLDTLTANLTVLGAKLDGFIGAASQKDATIAALTAELEALKASTSAGDSPEAIQAAADQVAAVSAKLP